MTPAPETIADQPDVLSELLRALRLTGAVFMDGQFTSPFGLTSPARWDAQDKMARLRHVSVFHLVAEGSCWLDAPGGSPCELSKGDIVLLPFTAAHRVWQGEPASFSFAPDLVQEGPINGVGRIRLGGGGEATRLVCGFLESAELMAAPLFRSLPPLLVERASADSVSSLLTSTAAEILRQVELAAPGAPFVLGRLMELLFVEVVRRHAERLPPAAEGVLAAMRDAIVGKAMWLLHQEPARKWSVEDLAGEVGSSRSVLVERFNQYVGKPPIEYLKGWRIQLACERLRSSRDPLARVAEAVGYESEAALSRAFKREMGVSPGAWRTD
jgi:AraC family transcriptional regulator, alkane utilization regulator